VVVGGGFTEVGGADDVGGAELVGGAEVVGGAVVVSSGSPQLVKIKLLITTNVKTSIISFLMVICTSFMDLLICLHLTYQ
jgi:hypothetical protein